MKEQLLTDISILPTPSRKESFLIKGGYPVPLLRRQISEWAVRVYLDVSVSVLHLLPVVYGLLIHLKDEIHEPIYGFSNQVTEIPLADSAHGKIETTYGTDFDCVAEHSLNHRFRRILVITDGEADFHWIDSNHF